MKNVLIASIFCLCLFGVSYGQKETPPQKPEPREPPQCESPQKPEPPDKPERPPQCELPPKCERPKPEPKDPCDNDRIIALGNARSKDN
jgi:hypothetical protein